MLEERFFKLKSVLEAGIKAHLESGGRIIFGAFYDKNNGKDPIWASIDSKKVENLDVNLVSKAHIGLNEKLGFKIAEIDMIGIVQGFDGLENKGADKMIFNLGKKLREKYIKEEKEETNETNPESSDLIEEN